MPRRERPLRGARIAALGALGLWPALSGCKGGDPAAPDPTTRSSTATPTGATTGPSGTTSAPSTAARGPTTALDGWSQIKRAFDEAEPIAANEKGSYPFDAAGKEALLRDLATARAAVDTIFQAGRIDEATADLLRDDLDYLRSAVMGFRARPEPGQREASCYEPLPVDPRAPSLDRLERRLPLVARMLTAARLDPEVLRKVISRLEAEVAEAEAWRAAHPDRAKSAAEDKTLADVRTRIKALRARLPGGN